MADVTQPITSSHPLPNPPPLAQGCPGNRKRLRGCDPVQPKRIPVAGLGPASHVFGAEILADLRRGCPGRARARGFGRVPTGSIASELDQLDAERSGCRQKPRVIARQQHGLALGAQEFDCGQVQRIERPKRHRPCFQSAR